MYGTAESTRDIAETLRRTRSDSAPGELYPPCYAPECHTTMLCHNSTVLS